MPELLIPLSGKLGEALKLPKITRQLSSKVNQRRMLGLQAFQELWPTLSITTRQQVEETIGWYDAKSLDWEDKRSNRRVNMDIDHAVSPSSTVKHSHSNTRDK